MQISRRSVLTFALILYPGVAPAQTTSPRTAQTAPSSVATQGQNAQSGGSQLAPGSRSVSTMVYDSAHFDLPKKKSEAPDGKLYVIGIHFGTGENEIVNMVTVAPVAGQENLPNPTMFYRGDSTILIYSIVPPEQGGYLLVTSIVSGNSGSALPPSAATVRNNPGHRSTTYYEATDVHKVLRIDRVMTGGGQSLVFWLRIEQNREIQVYPEAKDSKLAGATTTVGLNVPLTMFNKSTFENFNAPDVPRYFKVEKAGKGAVVKGSDEPFEK